MSPGHAGLCRPRRCPAPHPGAKSPASRARQANSSERQTLRWREPDSNSRFRSEKRGHHEPSWRSDLGGRIARSLSRCTTDCGSKGRIWTLDPYSSCPNGIGVKTRFSRGVAEINTGGDEAAFILRDQRCHADAACGYRAIDDLYMFIG